MNKSVCPAAETETLLVATDGSEFAKTAVRGAINLAGICSSKLIAISLVKTNLEFESVVPQVIEKEEKEAREHLESIKNEASSKGILCETIISLSDEPYYDIVNQASKSKANIIIMGTHGRTGIKRLMMGSVTAKVIGHAPCNVLVLPLDAKVECRNVLIATDGSKYSDAAASVAIGIAKRCGSNLAVISVASSDSEISSASANVKKVTDASENESIKTEPIVTRGTPYEVITATAKKKKADLIVMGSHGRKGFERLLMGSVTERVIGHSEAAVLVVRI